MMDPTNADDERSLDTDFMDAPEIPADSDLEDLERKAQALGITIQIADLGERIATNIKRDKEHLNEWRDNAREAYAFIANDHWSDEDKALLEEQNRPAVVFNRVCRVVNAVAGLEIQNRQEVSYVPRELGDVGVNELLTGAAKWARDNCDAGEEESDAFRDQLTCGMGWTDTAMDYEQDQEGMIVIPRIDPLEMGWDAMAKKKNLDDARRVWHARAYTRDEIMEEWPGADLQPGDFWGDIETEEHLADQAWEYKNDQTGDDIAEVATATIVRYQWFERRCTYMVLTEGGQMISFDQDRWKKVSNYILGKGLRYQKLTKRVYLQCFISGKQILDIMACPCDSDFTLRSQTGIRDRNRNYWFGLVELMKDPQRWANKWLSQIMYILNSNAKGGLLAEEGAFANPRAAEDDWAQSDSVVWLNEGGLQKIQQRDMGAYPVGTDKLLTYAVDSVSDVTGISNEFMGLTEHFQPGYVEAQRNRSSINLLAPYFDGLRRYRKEQGRVMAHFIREYIADGRLVRIASKQSAQYVPLVKDAVTFKYDIVVDDAPTSQNMREQVFSTLMQMIPLALQSGIPVPPEVIDYAPLPEALAQSWKQLIMSQGQDPMAQAAQQLDLADKQQEIAESKSKEALNYAKVQSEGVRPVVDISRARTEQDKAQTSAFKTGIDAANPNRGML